MDAIHHMHDGILCAFEGCGFVFYPNSPRQFLPLPHTLKIKGENNASRPGIYDEERRAMRVLSVGNEPDHS
jgi:hypothetical protein